MSDSARPTVDFDHHSPEYAGSIFESLKSMQET
jgi:hypothetical protein